MGWSLIVGGTLALLGALLLWEPVRGAIGRRRESRERVQQRFHDELSTIQYRLATMARDGEFQQWPLPREKWDKYFAYGDALWGLKDREVFDAIKAAYNEVNRINLKIHGRVAQKKSLKIRQEDRVEDAGAAIKSALDLLDASLGGSTEGG